MRFQRHRHHRALSLIEIMTVLVVLGMISTIVLPQLGSHDDLKVTSAARELVADLAYAQSQAIADGRFIYVVFDRASGKYSVLESIEPTKVLKNPASGEPYEIELGAGKLNGVAIKSAAFDDCTAVAFDAMGSPFAAAASGASPVPMDDGAIVLSCGDQTRTIVIEPVTGEIKVRE